MSPTLMLYQLFGVGALAHRGLSPVRGFVREVPLAFSAPHHSAREGCPGHCGTLAGPGGNSGLQDALRHGIGTKAFGIVKMLTWK